MTWTGVPRTRIVWKDGRNVVRLTGYRAGTTEQVTVEMTLDEWNKLTATQYAVEESTGAVE